MHYRFVDRAGAECVPPINLDHRPLPGDIIAWAEDFTVLGTAARYERHEKPLVRWVATLTVEPKAGNERRAK
jgi:hypothetical protein